MSECESCASLRRQVAELQANVDLCKTANYRLAADAEDDRKRAESAEQECKWRSIFGRYFEANTLEMDDDFAPEGWYEESESHEHCLPTNEPPTHWMPPPKEPLAAAPKEGM